MAPRRDELKIPPDVSTDSAGYYYYYYYYIIPLEMHSCTYEKFIDATES